MRAVWVTPGVVISGLVIAALRKFLKRRGRPSFDYTQLLGDAIATPASQDPNSLDKAVVSPLLVHAGKGGSAEPEAFLQRLADSGTTLHASREAQNTGSGASLPNPVSSGHEGTLSGSGAALAAAVAGGAASVGVGVDVLDGLRIQGARCGLFVCRATPGSLSKRDAASSIAWAARDADRLAAVGQSMRGQGRQGSRGDVLQVVVATSVFATYGGYAESAEQVLATIQLAFEAWAPELVHTGDLLGYLSANCNTKDGKDVMRVITDAARVLASGSEAKAGQLQAARQTQQNVEACLRDFCRGAILVLPALPLGPPRGSSSRDPSGASQRDAEGDSTPEAEEEEESSPQEAAEQLAALATISGFPQVCLPVRCQGPDGVQTASIAVLSLPRTDARLLEVAQQLAPLLARFGGQEHKPPGDRPGGPPSAPGASEKADAQAAKASAARQIAEDAKEEGNAAMRARQYKEAAKAYTTAIQAGPTAVLYSNRAQALLNLSQWSQAEEDCTASLKLEPSVKALLRRSTARAALGRTEQAQGDLQQVLVLEPNNRQAREQLTQLLKRQAAAVAAQKAEQEQQAKQAQQAKLGPQTAPNPKGLGGMGLQQNGAKAKQSAGGDGLL